MKIKIESDVYDIVERIKEIDDGYFIVFNTDRNCFELHNSKQLDSYCLKIPYEFLDERVLSLIYGTLISNIDNIVEDIDNNNNLIEEKELNKVKDVADYKVREIYKFASNSSKDLCGMFDVCWR